MIELQHRVFGKDQIEVELVAAAGSGKTTEIIRLVREKAKNSYLPRNKFVLLNEYIY